MALAPNWLSPTPCPQPAPEKEKSAAATGPTVPSSNPTPTVSAASRRRVAIVGMLGAVRVRLAGLDVGKSFRLHPAPVHGGEDQSDGQLYETNNDEPGRQDRRGRSLYESRLRVIDDT